MYDALYEVSKRGLQVWRRVVTASHHSRELGDDNDRGQHRDDRKSEQEGNPPLREGLLLLRASSSAFFFSSSVTFTGSRISILTSTLS
jgi:hypothetical protein